MLQTYLDKDHLRFPARVDGWRDAIEQVSEPLLESGAIGRDYVEAMLDSIAGGGTYIDLGFGIALAHARPEQGVRRTGMSALWTPAPVMLADDPNHQISLFVCLAAGDQTTHLDALRELGVLLSDDAARNRVLAAANADDAIMALTRGEQS